MNIKIVSLFVIYLLISLQLSWAEQPVSERESSIELKYKESQERIKQLEKRVSDLESIINKLIDGKKLTEDIDKGAEKVVEEKKPGTPPATEVEEWAEPAGIKETTTGRDEDARRRLSELETWKRKIDAKVAKEAEEEAEKVKFEFSGKYKVRLNIRNNLNLDNPAQQWQYDNGTYIDQRFQLGVDAIYGPLSFRLLLDKGNFVFDWKEDSQGTLDRWSEFQTVSAALVRELYMQYTGDFIFKAGRQTFFVGNDGIVLEGPMDALKITYPLGQTPIGIISANLAYMAIAGGWKDYNNFTFPAGDRTAVFGVANKLDGWLLSFDIKPKKNLTIEPYALKVYDRGKTSSPDLNLDKDFNAGTVSRDGHFEPLWTGIAISGKEGKVSFKGDLIYLTGSYTNMRDISAHAFLVRGDYSIKNDLSAGLEFGMGSGNTAEEKTAGTGYVNDFNGLFLCKDRRKFGNIFSEDLRAGFFLWDSNLANVTFIRAIADLEPVKQLKTNISLSKLWTTEGVYKGRGPIGDWSRGASAATEKTKDIGWEIDINLDFPLYKRLKGFVEAGYFVPGDVYQQSNGQKADPASEIVVGAELEF